MADSYNIQQISVQDTYPLRQKVLRPGLGIETCVFDGDADPNTVHFGAYADNSIVGIVTLCNRSQAGDTRSNVWQLRGMATDPEVRGQGYGKALVQGCLEYVQNVDGEQLWCNAREVAVHFYSKLGFETVGEKFEIKGVGPHYRMSVDF